MHTKFWPSENKIMSSFGGFGIGWASIFKHWSVRVRTVFFYLWIMSNGGVLRMHSTALKAGLIVMGKVSKAIPVTGHGGL
jgi:hypothetical protein